MKFKESISKHRIINNKIGFYIVTIICTIIVSLGVSTKCNAAVSDLAYIRSNTTSWANEYNQYFIKDNYGESGCYPPDYEKRYSYGDWEMKAENSHGETLWLNGIRLYYENESRKAAVVLPINSNSEETRYCDIYIDGKLEDSIILYKRQWDILCKLPIEIFSKAKDYKIEVVTLDKDNKELRTSLIVKVYRPFVLEKNLIKKIENTSDNSGLKVEWRDLGTVKSYYVYRAKEKDGFYKLMGMTYSPYLIDDDVEQGQKYYYHIIANFTNEETFQSYDVEGSLNNVKKPKSNKLNRPKIKIKKKSKKWQIYWGIISDKSSGIEVYMRNGHGKYKKFRKINTTKKLKKSKNKKGTVGITSSRKTLIKGVKYQFKARTFHYKTNGRKVYSKWSNIVKIKG